jgi:hypothetical protein
LHLERKFELPAYRKKLRIIDLLFAQEISRQTHHGLTGEPPKSEDFF